MSRPSIKTQRSRESSQVHSFKLWSHGSTKRCPPALIHEFDDLVLSIFPDPATIDVGWYRWWLSQQAAGIPLDLQACLEGFDEENLSQTSALLANAFLRISSSLRSQFTPLTIDNLVHDLTENHILKERLDLHRKRVLVFAIIGWQTMLYKPDLGTSLPQHLAVVQEYDGLISQTILPCKQASSAAKRPLSTFLLGFGLLIPQRNTCLSEDAEDRQAYRSFLHVDSQQINAFVLHGLAHLDLRWVDTLSMHLELDKEAKVLYLFRYPSFCVANLVAEGQIDILPSVICCYGSEDPSEQWVSQNDINAFLNEVVLSYRLLFGQVKSSRQFFRRHLESLLAADILPEGRDPLLAQFCGRKSAATSVLAKDKSVYRLDKDFPILHSRLAILAKQVDGAKPRGWKELWRDKRDSAQWVTFWAVIIIGSLGLLLALLQVIIGVLQVTQSS